VKAFFFFFCIITMTVSAGAWGLDSHYGRVSRRGSDYSCTFYNNTGHALNMKYVVFHVDSFSGDDLGNDVQERIDKIVYPGHSLTSSKNLIGAYTVSYCLFLSR
jgi:hypothetical protein